MRIAPYYRSRRPDGPQAASAISTDTPGRVDTSPSAVLQALESSGESYNQARKMVKPEGVSVDASGKVELEDWVEVRP